MPPKSRRQISSSQNYRKWKDRQELGESSESVVEAVPDAESTRVELRSEDLVVTTSEMGVEGEELASGSMSAETRIEDEFTAKITNEPSTSEEQNQQQNVQNWNK